MEMEGFLSVTESYFYDFGSKTQVHSRCDDHLISRCIYRVSYHIVINEAPVSQISVTRGIKQGDPFSLIFLFYVKMFFP
ncbi:hypothetical protein EPI10_006800 [Gossypium australe]|uniref:Reverse transcriptase n=1 Tax=Gossypium australe TaxID=47621 RepID=A0A5B6WUG4_9ROSI|nr:hypothetical protein EPI10_006800 [Gossypium australe]